MVKMTLYNFKTVSFRIVMCMFQRFGLFHLDADAFRSMAELLLGHRPASASQGTVVSLGPPNVNDQNHDLRASPHGVCWRSLGNTNEQQSERALTLRDRGGYTCSLEATRSEDRRGSRLDTVRAVWVDSKGECWSSKQCGRGGRPQGVGVFLFVGA